MTYRVVGVMLDVAVIVGVTLFVPDGIVHVAVRVPVERAAVSEATVIVAVNVPALFTACHVMS